MGGIAFVSSTRVSSDVPPPAARGSQCMGQSIPVLSGIHRTCDSRLRNSTKISMEGSGGTIHDSHTQVVPGCTGHIRAYSV